MCKIANVCVSFFKSQRILKTTKTTDITEDDLYNMTTKYNITGMES